MRRIAIIIFGICIIIFGFIQSPFVKSFIQKRLYKEISSQLNGKIEWTRISWNPLLTRVSLDNLQWTAPGEETPFLTIRQLRFVINWWLIQPSRMLRHVELVGPTIRLPNKFFPLVKKKVGPTDAESPSVYQLPRITVVDLVYTGRQTDAIKVRFEDVQLYFHPDVEGRQRLEIRGQWGIGAEKFGYLNGRLRLDGQKDPESGWQFNVFLQAPEGFLWTSTVKFPHNREVVDVRVAGRMTASLWKHLHFSPYPSESFYQRWGLRNPFSRDWRILGSIQGRTGNWQTRFRLFSDGAHELNLVLQYRKFYGLSGDLELMYDRVQLKGTLEPETDPERPPMRSHLVLFARLPTPPDSPVSRQIRGDIKLNFSPGKPWYAERPGEIEIHAQIQAVGFHQRFDWLTLDLRGDYRAPNMNWDARVMQAGVDELVEIHGQLQQGNRLRASGRITPRFSRTLIEEFLNQPLMVGAVPFEFNLDNLSRTERFNLRISTELNYKGLATRVSGQLRVRDLDVRPRWSGSLLFIPDTGGQVTLFLNGSGRNPLFSDWELKIRGREFLVPETWLPVPGGLYTLKVQELNLILDGYGPNPRQGTVKARGLTEWNGRILGQPDIRSLTLPWTLHLRSEGYTRLWGRMNLANDMMRTRIDINYLPVEKNGGMDIRGYIFRAVWEEWIARDVNIGSEIKIRKGRVSTRTHVSVGETLWKTRSLGKVEATFQSSDFLNNAPILWSLQWPGFGLDARGRVVRNESIYRFQGLVHFATSSFTHGAWSLDYHGRSRFDGIRTADGKIRIDDLSVHIDNLRAQWKSKQIFNVVNPISIGWHDTKWQYVAGMMETPGGRVTLQQAEDGFFILDINGRIRPIIRLFPEQAIIGNMKNLDMAYRVRMAIPSRQPEQFSIEVHARDLRGLAGVRMAKPCSVKYQGNRHHLAFPECRIVRLREDGQEEIHTFSGGTDSKDGALELIYRIENGAPGEWLTALQPSLPWLLITPEEHGLMKSAMMFRFDPTGDQPIPFQFLWEMDEFIWSTPYGLLTLSKPWVLSWNNTSFRVDFRHFLINNQPIPVYIRMEANENPLSPEQWFNRQFWSGINVEARWEGSLATGPLLAPLGMMLDGEINGRLMMEGPLHHPLIYGQLRIDDAHLWDPDFSLSLPNISGLLDVNGIEKIVLHLEGKGIRGAWNLDAEARYNPVEHRFDLPPVRLVIRDLELMSPLGWRVRTRGDIQLVEQKGEYRLTGRIDVPYFEYFAPFRLRELFEEETIREPRWWEQLPVWLDIHLRVDRTLISNNLADLTGAGEWEVTGSIRNPTVTGQWTLSETGYLQVQDVPYRIQQGVLTWAAERDWFDPQVDMTLNAILEPPPGMETRLTVDIRISGTVSEPRLSFQSDPPLSEPEILAVLTTGSYVSRGDTALTPADLGRAMIFSIGGSLTRTILNPVTGLLGVRSITFQPIVGSLRQGEDLDPTARVNIVRPIRSWLTTTFSMDVRNTANQDWILDVQPTSWTTLRIIRSFEEEGRSWTVGFRGQIAFPFRRFTTPWAFRRPRPKRFLIADIKTTGEWPWPQQTLEKVLQIKPGKKVELTRVNERLLDVEQRVRQLGYYQAVIQWWVEPVEEGGPYILNIHLIRGPRYRLVIQGPEGKEPRFNLREPLIQSCFLPFTPRAVVLSCLKSTMISLLEQKRFIVSDVTIKVDEQDVHTIILLSYGRIGSFKEYDLKWNGDPWIRLKENQERLVRVCREALGLDNTVPDGWVLWRGRRFCITEWKNFFQKVRLKPRQIRIMPRPLSDRVEIDIFVDLGEPVIASVSVESPIDINNRSEFQNLVGTLFIPDRVEKKLQALCQHLRRSGYPRARCAYRWSNEDHQLKIKIQPEEKAVIETVVWPDTYLRRWGPGLTGIHEGIVWTPDRARKAGQRLRELDLYQSVRFETEPTESGKGRRLRVIVEPRPIVQLTVGLRDRTEFGPEFETFGWFRERWLFGTTFFAGTQVSSTVRRFRGGLVFPHLFTLPATSQIYFLRERIDEGGFITREDSITFEQGWRLGNHLQWTYRFNTRHVRVTEKEPLGPFPFDFETRINRLSTDIRFDTRDDILDPRKGTFFLATVEYAPKLLGGEIGFLKGFTQLAHHIPLGHFVVIAGDIRLGLAHPFEGDLLRSERFFIGGATSFRGASFQSLGPRDPFTGVIRGGEALFLSNIEVRFYPFRTLSLAAFLDVGNVFDKIDNLSLSLGNLHEATGIGLRWLSPLGLIRLDWGYRLDPLGDERRSRLYFAFGHIF